MPEGCFHCGPGSARLVALLALTLARSEWKQRFLGPTKSGNWRWRARKIVGQEARNDSNQQCLGACAVEDLYPAKRGGVQPGMQEGHAAWLMREYAINYDLQGPRAKHGK